MLHSIIRDLRFTSEEDRVFSFSHLPLLSLGNDEAHLFHWDVLLKLPFLEFVLPIPFTENISPRRRRK